MQPTIAITLYRRPKYTKILFDALLKCDGIEKTPITISCDYANAHIAACEEVVDLAFEFRDKVSNGLVTVYEQSLRYGIDLNKLFVVPKALERGDMLIFLEDDTVPSKDALTWFEQIVQHHPNAIACGYAKTTREELMMDRGRDTIRTALGFNPWGWAMYQPLWEKLFANDGRQYRVDTGQYANGSFDSWIGKKQLQCISPVIARIQSIGGEDAEHTPSPEWHKENEFNEFGMWNLPQ